MILSMTGFGKASSTIGPFKLTASVRSLNSKQLDLSTRIASRYKDRELELRTRLTQQLSRGKVDFALQVEPISGNSQVAPFSKAIATEYSKQIREFCREQGTDVPENLMEIVLAIPAIYKMQDQDEPESDELTDAEWTAVLSTVDSAIEQLIAFRTQEGRMLEQIFRIAIGNIAELVNRVEAIEPLRVESIRRQLEEKLEQLSSSNITYDKGRLEQELIFYIEKLDVSEERHRLQNHLQYFLKTMDLESGQGKKLGFIAQEIGREINTLGSKSNEIQMQQYVVQMKDELEQIKEQVLNTL